MTLPSKYSEENFSTLCQKIDDFILDFCEGNTIPLIDFCAIFLGRMEMICEELDQCQSFHNLLEYAIAKNEKIMEEKKNILH